MEESLDYELVDLIDIEEFQKLTDSFFGFYLAEYHGHKKTINLDSIKKNTDFLKKVLQL